MVWKRKVKKSFHFGHFIFSYFHSLLQDQPHKWLHTGLTSFLWQHLGSSNVLSIPFAIEALGLLCTCTRLMKSRNKFIRMRSLFLSLLRYSWYTTVCKFKVYNMVIWSTYIMWNDYHIRMLTPPSPYMITISLFVVRLLKLTLLAAFSTGYGAANYSHHAVH